MASITLFFQIVEDFHQARNNRSIKNHQTFEESLQHERDPDKETRNRDNLTKFSKSGYTYANEHPP